LAFPRLAWLVQRPLKPSVQSSARCGTPSFYFAVGFEKGYINLTASQSHAGPEWSDYYPQVSQNNPNALAPFFIAVKIVFLAMTFDIFRGSYIASW